MKKLMCVLALATTLALAGCSGDGELAGGQGGNAAPAGGGQAESAAPAEDAVKIDQIDYQVTGGVVNGTRRAVFSYTNNSDYTIVGAELELTFQDEVASEDIAGAFDYLIDLGLTEEEILDATMRCEDSFIVEPGQTSRDNTVNLGGYYVNNVEQYELMSPDLMTIYFLCDGKVYAEYYDFLSDSYSLSSTVVDTTQWGEGELCQAVPRPEDGLVMRVDEDDARFSFDVSGMTQEGFDAYVSACKEAGFTVDVSATDSVYYADNEEGTYHIDLIYWEDSGELSAYVDLVDEE